ncbi:hypothetical protein [Sediminispirochaeta smaragdinae]|uniref:hypothetical protein n=1 Tax=Sediminispirochaeta smaragdinae TaxID=55206 RepID=UPI00031332A7|nr:hypothetical protein [Sediminispirochaeta smaragdinae]
MTKTNSATSAEIDTREPKQGKETDRRVLYEQIYRANALVEAEEEASFCFYRRRYPKR